MDKRFVFIALYLVLALGLLVFTTNKHEEAHAKFCVYAGGVPVVSFTNFGLTGETRCDVSSLGESSITVRDKILLDGVNEATSYEIMPLILVFAAGQILTLLLTMKGD